jgi:hypothetical protein
MFGFWFSWSFFCHFLVWYLCFVRAQMWEKWCCCCSYSWWCNSCVCNLLIFFMLFPLPLKEGSWFMVFAQGDQLLILMIDSRIKYLKPCFPSINIVWMQYVTIYHWELSMSTLHFCMFWTTCGIFLITINYFVDSKIGFLLAPKVLKNLL